MPAARYVIWSFEHDAWWGPDESGYVQQLHHAGRYTAEDAGRIVVRSIELDEVAILESVAIERGRPSFHPYLGPQRSSSTLEAFSNQLKHELESKCSMHVGKVLRHPDGRLVKVISGQFLRNGLVSNWWEWREVQPDGTLSANLESGYGW
jgi:hypothetical protein